ncbi:MoaD/ThiS family protein [Pengzhenrongella frigida]|uniref:MoaD/ThiS family protein n=1 Tax=Pengzhenrongella frigida TaxID=1259133 RepID=A0A4Q5MYP1_9MICO|nr:MoaD/ThiS family protein [Cellulomonas sp. HLT2-17]RYV50810.1 MoaD/ThiS family protein [Cellulomonas sp. HLT2-17]
MPDTLMVTLRYFAGAGAAAGVEEEQAALPVGSTVADALGGAGDRRGPALTRVIAASSVMVDGVHQHTREATLRDGATLDVLPPFAGG